MPSIVTYTNPGSYEEAGSRFVPSVVPTEVDRGSAADHLKPCALGRGASRFHGVMIAKRITVLYARAFACLFACACAHETRELVRTAPVGGRAVAPALGLGIEVIEIREAAAGKEAVADVADGALDATLLIAARDRYGARLIAIMPGKAQQGRMESDRIATPVQHHALEIVVQQDMGDTVPRGERRDVAAQEVLHPGVREEAQEDLPRMAQHHDERHQRAACPADLEMAEMSPVHLRLFARQATQPQIRLGLRARPMAGDQVAEVIGAAAIAALAHHPTEQKTIMHEMMNGAERRAGSLE